MIDNLFFYPPTIETNRLILRRIRRRDAKDLFDFARREEVSRYVLWSPHKSIHDSRRYIRYCIHQYHDGYPGVFAIVVKSENRMIGTIGFVSFSGEHRCAEIGYSLNPDYWNQGFMTEALSRVIRYSFEQLKLHRVEACHDIRNAASGRVMEKCGMCLEGILQDRYNNKGAFCSVRLYAIVNRKPNE